jgi:uncharacterized protein with PIN domain
VTDARYFLDENVLEYLVAPLRRAGFDVFSATEAGRKGKTDAEQLRWATEQGRVLITHDRDFLRIARLTTSHAGLGYAHQEKYRDRPGALIRRLEQLHLEMTAEDWQAQLVFL